MAANNRELEEKTNKIAEGKIEEGQEPQKFQEAQNHLLQVQAAQNENLQVERAISGAQAQNNQTMAQAAELMAMSNAEGGGPVQGRGVQLNPQTQAILGKYGYGKPRTQTSTSTNSGPVQGRGIVINNRTENKTTNNVQVSTPPAQITKTSSSDGGMAKFKTWMTSNLASQKEQEAIRERNYQRKEWSLSRSSKKMMERLEELGKTIGENLDPRKVGTVLMDQLKVLLFLLGFQFLSKNWDKILKSVSKIEGFIKGLGEFFGVEVTFSGDDFLPNIKFHSKSGFSSTLIRLFGGDPNKDTIGSAIKGFFQDGFDYLLLKLKHELELRGLAVQAVKKSHSENKGGNWLSKSISNAVKGSIDYIGDIISAFLNPNKLNNVLQDKVELKGNEFIKEQKDLTSGRQIKSTEKKFNKNDKDVYTGDARVLTNYKTESKDFDGTELSNNTVSTILASKEVNKLLETGNYLEEKDGKYVVRNDAIMGRLSQISRKVNEEGSAVVPVDFVKAIETLTGTFFTLNKKLKYKFILDDGEKGKEYRLVPIDDPHQAETITYKDPSTGKEKTVSSVEFYRLRKDELSSIERQIAELAGVDSFKFDSSDPNSLNIVGQFLIKAAKKRANELRKGKVFGVSVKNKFNRYYYSSVNGRYVHGDVDIPDEDAIYISSSETGDLLDTIQSIKEFNDKKEAFRSEEEEAWKNNRVNKAIDNAGDMITDVVNSASDFFGMDYHKPVRISDEEKKSRVLTAMNYFMKTEGLTAEQAAGLVGNLYHESMGLNHKAFPHDKNGKPLVDSKGRATTAYGLAQWTESSGRQAEFKKKFGHSIRNSTFDEQLRFISHELETTHSTAKKLLKNAKTVKEAADIAFGYYEFSGGVESAKAELNKHSSVNQNGDTAQRDKRNRAEDVYKTFMDSKNEDSATNTSKDITNSDISILKSNSNSKSKTSATSIPKFDWSKTSSNKIRSNKVKKTNQIKKENVRAPFKIKEEKVDYTKPFWSADIGKSMKDSNSKGFGEKLDLIKSSVDNLGSSMRLMAQAVDNNTRYAAATGNTYTNITNNVPKTDSSYSDKNVGNWDEVLYG